MKKKNNEKLSIRNAEKLSALRIPLAQKQLLGKTFVRRDGLHVRRPFSPAFGYEGDYGAGG